MAAGSNALISGSHIARLVGGRSEWGGFIVCTTKPPPKRLESTRSTKRLAGESIHLPASLAPMTGTSRFLSRGGNRRERRSPGRFWPSFVKGFKIAHVHVREPWNDSVTIANLWRVIGVDDADSRVVSNHHGHPFL